MQRSILNVRASPSCSLRGKQVELLNFCPMELQKRTTGKIENQLTADLKHAWLREHYYGNIMPY